MGRNAPNTKQSDNTESDWQVVSCGFDNSHSCSILTH